MGTTTAPADSYKILDKASIPAYLATIPAVREILGLCDSLDIQEIGDGNLNYVYRVSKTQDSTKSVILKQAVPFLRMVGTEWPLDRDRMRYEIRALTIYNELVPSLAPKIYHADEDMSTLVMQCLNDHIILRAGMIDGVKYPKVANDLGHFLAETLFRTSAWSMGSLERRELMDKFTLNSELCKLTEDFIFTFPYMSHESNYSNAKTDEWVKEHIHGDYQYKRNVLALKEQFVSKSEALLHADLHSGSLMVNQDESYVIDMEFAYFGPIAFDVGKVISNFLLCCTSHYYRDGGSDYRQWILDQIPIVWNTFESRFIALWAETGHSTMLMDGFFSAEDTEQFRTQFMLNIFQDAIGFASCSMARRTIGIAGVADIRDIEDLDIRSNLEITNLKLSKSLMAHREKLKDVDELMSHIFDFYSAQTI